MKDNHKTVAEIIPPPPFHMVGDGFRVHNFFPSLPVPGLHGMSPFFLMDYNSKWLLSPSERQRGVGVHPHRGFETVTIAFHGKIAHHDSAGNSGIIGEGDVQWMTAGEGVLHKEYHEKEFSREGGIFQMVQLWVNLPAKFKMTPAKYQAIENKDMGKIILPKNQGIIDIIAGEYNGIKGPAFTFSPMNMFNARLNKNGQADFSFPETFNTGILIVEGEVRINNTVIAPEDNFIYFGKKGTDISMEALKNSTILILSGEPINEPIASYGPFVMNTDDELRKAYEDFHSGKFGYLED
ncbi:MAG TPA: short-chain dehydrogenase [Bacteroidales bacterium]|nr:short-chain dehydrogenase [Bacteroidales bacterium]